jgi:SNF2 family DNA or RNA helicase
MPPTLFDHQETAAPELASSRFKMLWDVPGLGKTITTVRGADLLRAMRILVICPANLRVHWLNSFQEWQTVDRKLILHKGNTIDVSADDPAVHSVSSTALSYEAPAKALLSKYWDLVIVDEADAFRSFTATRTVNLLFDQVKSLKARTYALWALTGTPIVASAADLYPFYYAMGLGPLSELQFRDYFTNTRIDYYGNIKSYGIKNKTELLDIFRPWVIRRTLESVGIELPPLHVSDLPVQVSPSELETLKLLSDTLTPAQIDSLIESEETNTSVTTLRRALGNVKAALSVERMAQCYHHFDRRPTVGFFYHKEVGQAVKNGLEARNYKTAVIEGGISRAQLKEAQDAFREKRIQHLLVQEQAGGVGLTLTTGSYGLIVESPWTATAKAQEMARLHRITQVNPVVIELAKASGIWVEDIISASVARKASDAANILQPLTRNY